MLQFDVSDVTREGVGVSCQLMVGQSSVPHYQQLEEFTARLAPGEVSVSLRTNCRSFLICSDFIHCFFCATGEPDPAPALPGSVQHQRSQESQSFPRVHPRPESRPLARRSVAGTEPESAGRPGGSAAAEDLAGLSVSEEGPGGKQSVAPQLQPLPGAVAAGVPVAAGGRGHGSDAPHQFEPKRDQPGSLRRVQERGGPSGSLDGWPAGTVLSQYRKAEPDAHTLPPQKLTWARRTGPLVRQLGQI